VLQFGCAADQEPLLGFVVVLLLEVQQSFLPTANTSTNTSNQRRANA
jgi:hypothetical protein